MPPPLQFGRIPVLSYRSTRQSNPAFSHWGFHPKSSPCYDLMMLKGLYVLLSRPGLTTVMPFTLVLVRPLSHACSWFKTLQLQHISTVPASLHWLPVLGWILRFYCLTLNHQMAALQPISPTFLNRMLLRSLRSANQMLSMVPTSGLKHREEPSFAVVAPKLWNELLLCCYAGPHAASF